MICLHGLARLSGTVCASVENANFEGLLGGGTEQPGTLDLGRKAMTQSFSNGSIPYLPPLTFGPGSVDWQHRIDPAELRRQRMERARETLRLNGISAILASGSEYSRYLTGLRGPEFAPDLWYVLFPAESEPVVFAHAGYVCNTPPEAPWIKEWRVARSWLRGIPGKAACVYEATEFAKDVRTELEKLHLANEPLAVAGFDGYAQTALGEICSSIVPGDEIMLEAMAIKTSEEVSCLRMAGAITDRMWAAIARGMHSGMTDSEVAAIGRSAGSSVGADRVVAGFRSGPLAWERGIKGTNLFIIPGDLLFGNVCGTSYLGYNACSYRTFSVGREPTKDEKGYMEELQSRLLGVISELVPGGDTSAAARHFPDAKDLGYEKEAELLTIEIGHGIGLHQYEQPVVNRQWSLEFPQEVKEGMTVAVEGRAGVPGKSTVRIEYMVVVTKDGPMLIDRYPTDIITVS